MRPFKLRTVLGAFLRPFDYVTPIGLLPRRNSLLRASRLILGMAAAGCILGLSFGCNTYNPYLGASPTVSSSITSISPNGANAGTPNDIPLTVTGSGFVAGSNVTWNGNGSATNLPNATFVSSTKMQATIPKALLATPGTYSIGVIAPGPTSGNNAGNNISNFMPFIVFPPSGSVVPDLSSKTSTSSLNPRLSRPSSPVQMPSRYQAFVADSADGSIETATGIARVFLRDSCLGAVAACAPQIIPVSVGWNGADPNGPSTSPSVSADGRFVVFASEANNLVKGDSNGWSDIFLRDTCLGAASTCVPATIRLSLGPDGAEADGPSFSPAISPDARFVAFNSWATNLTPLEFLNSLPVTSTPPLFLRDTCFGAASACVPATSRVIPASALQR